MQAVVVDQIELVILIQAELVVEGILEHILTLDHKILDKQEQLIQEEDQAQDRMLQEVQEVQV
jgi:hypothetical protein